MCDGRSRLQAEEEEGGLVRRREEGVQNQEAGSLSLLNCSCLCVTVGNGDADIRAVIYDCACECVCLWRLCSTQRGALAIRTTCQLPQTQLP